MDESRGEFLAWLDQDDLAYKDRIATQVLFLDRNPHVSICGSFTETLVQPAGIPSRVRLEAFPKSHRQIRTAMVFSQSDGVQYRDDATEGLPRA